MAGGDTCSKNAESRYQMTKPETILLGHCIKMVICYYVHSAEAERDELSVDLQIRYTGRVFCAPHRVIKSGCLIDVTNYPFDTQTCHLWIQSVSRYDFQMDLVPYYKEPLDLSTYLSCFKEAVVSMLFSNLWLINTIHTQKFLSIHCYVQTKSFIL